MGAADRGTGKRARIAFEIPEVDARKGIVVVESCIRLERIVGLELQRPQWRTGFCPWLAVGRVVGAGRDGRMVGIRDPRSPAVAILVVVATEKFSACTLLGLVQLDFEGLVDGRVEIVSIRGDELDDRV